MAYDFRADYSGIAPGTRYQVPQMKIAWNNNPLISLYRNLDNGILPIYTIVDDPIMGRCLQQFYPLGVLGGSYKGNPFPTESSYGSAEDQIFPPPTDVANVAFNVMFPSGRFDLVGSQGKIWRIGNGNSGVRLMWNYTVLNQGNCHFRFFAEDLSGANTYPSLGCNWDIVPDTIYRIHLQLAPDPATGYQKVFIKRPTDPTEIMYYNNGPIVFGDINTSSSCDHSSFFGGGGPLQAAKQDSYMLTSAPHVWSGTGAETGLSTDSTPPSVPTGLGASLVAPTAINLLWNASTDNVGVAGYHLRRGGTIIATQAGLTFSDTGLSPNTSYSYTVDAFDAAGNTSAQSLPFVQRTPGVLAPAAAALVGGGSVFAIATSTFHPAAGTILHKTYDPHSGIYGAPNGNDWTAVFANITAAFLADQEAQGDGMLRIFIPLRGGINYDFTYNRWTCGAQFLTVYHDQNFPGPQPQLRNIQTAHNYDVEIAALVAGGGSFLDFFVADPNGKAYESRINSAKVGDTNITLKTPANASNLRVGRWHLVLSFDQQAGGGPPNSRYFDYVKVTAINGAVVTLDRPLRHRHSDTFWENFPQDGISFGMARIMPMDVGGAGGVEHTGTGTLVRLTQRQTWIDIKIVPNPNFNAGEGDLGTFINTSGLAAFWVNCSPCYFTPTIVQHFGAFNCTIPQRVEIDKLIDIIDLESSTIGGPGSEGTGSATGCELLFIRGSSIAECTSSPRQLRFINSTIDPHLGSLSVNDTPYLPAYPGPLLSSEWLGATFKVDTVNTTGRIMFSVALASGVLGTDFTWSGSRLLIPMGSGPNPSWLDYLAFAWEGAIIFAGTDQRSLTSWGYVANITSPGDGTAVWLDVVWVVGIKPASGTLSISRGGSILFDSACVLGPGANLGDSGFIQQTCPPSFGSNFNYPVGYPSPNNAFGAPSYNPNWTAALPMAAAIVAFVNTLASACAGSGALVCDAGTLSIRVQSGSAILAAHGTTVPDARPTEWWLGSVGGATVNLSLTTQFNVLPGESILVLASSNAAGTQATGCTDSAGNIYTLVDVGASFADETHIIACSRCPNGLPAGGTITITFAGAATDHLIEAFGCRESLTSDVGSSIHSFTSVTSNSSSTGILGANQEIVWAHIVFAGNPGVVSIAAPFKLADAVISNNISAVSAYARVASNASVTASWSWATAQSGGSHYHTFITVNLVTATAALAGSGLLLCDAAPLTSGVTSGATLSASGRLICDARPTLISLGFVGGNGSQLNLTTIQNAYAGESIVLFGSTTGVGQQGTGATDSAGNTYSLIDAGPSFTLETQLFVCLVLTSDLPAGSVISMAFAGATADKLLEAYMVHGSLILDWGTAGNAGTGTTTPSRTTATFAQAEEIVFTHVCWGANPGNPVGVGAPFHYATLGAPTIPPTAGIINQSTDMFALTGYARIHSPTAFSYQDTWPTSVTFREHGYSFRVSQQQQASVGLSGQGAVAAAAIEIATDFLMMNGQGALGCDSVHAVIDTAETLAAAGTLSADSFTFSGIASGSSPIGTGSLAATAFLYDIGVPQEAGAGTLTIGLTNSIVTATALVAGAGAVIAAARHVIPSPASAMAGQGVVQALAALRAIDSGALVGTGALFAFPGGLFAAAEADGAGVLTAVAVRWQADSGPEELDGLGSLTIASGQSPIAAAALVGASTLSCRAVTIDSASASVIGGDGEVSAAVLILRVAPSILAGAGAVAFAAYRETFGSASLFDLSSLVCFPMQTAAQSIVASGAGSVAASATIVVHASEAVAGAGSVAAQATHNPPASASLLGAGTAGAPAKVNIGAASASLAGTGSMAASPAATVIAMPQIFGGGGAIIAFGGIPGASEANLNGSGALQIAEVVAIHATASLIGETNLDPDASIIEHLNDNNLMGAGAMFCDAIHPVSVSANLGEASFLVVDDASVEFIVYPARIKVRTRKVRALAA